MRASKKVGLYYHLVANTENCRHGRINSDSSQKIQHLGLRWSNFRTLVLSFSSSGTTWDNWCTWVIAGRSNEHIWCWKMNPLQQFWLNLKYNVMQNLFISFYLFVKMHCAWNRGLQQKCPGFNSWDHVPWQSLISDQKKSSSTTRWRKSRLIYPVCLFLYDFW